MTPQERRNLLYKRWRKAEQQKVDAKELRDPTTCDMVVFDLELAATPKMISLKLLPSRWIS